LFECCFQRGVGVAHVVLDELCVGVGQFAEDQVGVGYRIDVGAVNG
jgi:hypothetical protein